MADGSRHNIGYVEEVTRGITPANPVFKRLRHTSTSLALSKNTVQSEEIRSDRQISDFRHGAFQVGGDIGFELSYGTFDDLLEAVTAGTWVADTPAVGTDQLKCGIVRRSFTIEREFSDIASVGKPFHRFTACEFSSMQLQVTADAIVTGTMTLVGSGMATDAAIIAGATYTPASTTTPLDSFTGTLTEDGSLIAVITEIQLNLENSLNPRFVVGSKEGILPSIGRSNVSGQITAYFEDSTLLDKFIDETESSIEFTLPDTAGNEYKFILPRVKYNGGQPDVSGEGSITLSMPFQALLDDTYLTNLVIERTPI